MYFEIENTPEHLKRARRKENVQRASPKEECPRLILAPFSRPPQVVFDNVVIGTTCEKNLEILNPSKAIQQITLGKSLPPGLIIQLPGEYLELEPETCYCITMLWTPTQPTALRETIRFTNENRGRYDVIIVLKSVMNVKGKNNTKLKISPGKIKKKSGKKSPAAIYKKKVETIYNTTKVKKTVNVVHSTHYKVFNQIDKENVSYNDCSMEPKLKKCPFDSPTNLDLNFNTSEIFSNVQRNKKDMLYETYDKSYNVNEIYTNENNILKPSNRQINDSSVTDVFDNISFTPLKSLPTKNDKLVKGPKIILSVNSESDFDDSLDIQGSNKENETHSILCITSSQNPNKWLTVNHHVQYENNQCNETPTLPNKKIPNTSSPKELNSPNFSINTEFSRISDLSFFPQRFSTERKIIPKMYNETHDIIEDNARISSDTYTKESPNTPMYFNSNQVYGDSKQAIPRESNPKVCRHALFKEHFYRDTIDRNVLARPESYPWNNDLRTEIKSPPRSLTPPLQSIPEESIHFSDTHLFDKTNKQMSTFTINRTFDKADDSSKSSVSSNRQSAWSKRAVRAEPELWKMPTTLPRKSLKSKNISQTLIKSRDSITGKGNQSFDTNKSINQNISLNHMGNVYSQSFTVDPFLSTTYFYDEEAVDKFENEFRRWLNCILTPPADLDSNIEQKIDVGKAWIENRNKEIPAAPTKEQVCSAYHNSHRLDSLRRTARALLLSPEISQVFIKLNLQIEKKLIAIRTDRNLHLDIGLQKIIMELLLSYNPLWLRIGLEAIYGLVLPLKSNSDVEGLTTFIIHRMFKNPHLKNKHSKSSAPNMLLPAYMEAIKKFTLKKFFMLVFFLDQAKQKKIIPHDPCLFCRNAICKESRDIILRFTRELIAGIGDITKHLRPLGYVVCHKQSYLDEYKYAVHNIAVDIRDGVRLTKVMEIILMKNGLLNQLRTPAISRLQKIHNVQVALNALKEANFVIVGDISASDIADGHREKTLSLLWQLIHVFRAPLFEKAANIIQTWWRKKYDIIVEKRKEEEKIMAQRDTAASTIQYWWRRIKYNRMVEYKMYQVTTATIVIQKYCRMWICRTHLRKQKYSAVKIATWYKNKKKVQEAKEILQALRLQREKLQQKSATIIQAHVKRWLCLRRYNAIKKKIVLVQSIIRQYLARKWYVQLQRSVLFIQQKYRSKILMRKDMQKFVATKQSAILIQSYFRMMKHHRYFLALKKSVRIIENRYKALIVMRNARTDYLKLKDAVIKVQSLYKMKIMHAEYIQKRNLIIYIQRKFKANQKMKKEKSYYLKLRNSSIVLQRRFKAYLKMKETREEYRTIRNSVIKIQTYFRSYLEMKDQRHKYILLRKSAVKIQTQYRSLLAMRRDRNNYLKLKESVVALQIRYRAIVLMREIRKRYLELRNAAIVVQKRYKALLQMRTDKSNYAKIKASCIVIQNAYRAYLLGKHQRQLYIQQRNAVSKIQNWFRCSKKAKEVKKQYLQTKRACVIIQNVYRAYIIGRMQRLEYLKMKTATICIQQHFRSYLLTKTIRAEYIQIKTSTITIQRFYRSYLITKQQRQVYLTMKQSAKVIQTYYKQYQETKKIRQKYCQLLSATIYIQNKYRSIKDMRYQRSRYLSMKHSAVVVQRRYRALLAMRKERQVYLKKRSAAVYLQNKFRAQNIMKEERKKFLKALEASKKIQAFYRAYKIGVSQKNMYLQLRKAAITLQQRFKATIFMRKERQSYLKIKFAVLTLQRRYRAKQLMLEAKAKFDSTLKACITIQKFYRARLVGRKQRSDYVKLKSAVTVIQTRFREIMHGRKLRNDYIRLRSTALFIQRNIRARNAARKLARKMAIEKIEMWYISIRRRNECRNNFINIREKIITLQSIVRMRIIRRYYLCMRSAAITIQRHYRSYILAKMERKKYEQSRTSIIKLQAHVRSFIERKRYIRLRATVLVIQAVYRLKRHRVFLKKQREVAATCIQKNARRYFIQSWYKRYREQVIFVQKQWRGKLLTRLLRNEFLEKRNIILKIQAFIRGHLIRKAVEYKKENLLKLRTEQQRNWAATKIQALFRGHKARMVSGMHAYELRRRWRNGGLESSQESLKERNEDAMEVLRKMSDIETVIRAFRSVELLTEVYPITYNENASSVVRRVYIYMSVTNRSISSVEVLKSAASLLVNLTRYKITGPKIYARDRIPPVLKFMWRFSNSETQLFCILSTYLWLFSKYDEVKSDLTNFLHEPENHKILVSIRGNVMRMKRMASNVIKNKFSTPQPSKYVSHTMNQSLRDMNHSICCNSGYLLPALEPDYGIIRADKPRYFQDPQQAICCLFETYEL
ncbi:protein abnormal spindle [Nymphalis io]|uniref:protein abnormal spindle n=1 Tax=Inachis io TaxID=171585 RepID=UPI0021685249|nr:protein abnormal spindle [Nymphalis io]